ncbi:hypothetical protein EVAR_27627_1 [Eumeta japonica]|uniref:Uncharacterized protein n=1 Tax=Eumeta variegata TaxID=151549 RepID=A0A4C1V0C6_EUMVA|nr:hypothetical protein EVAR_27627_1 [Eumeta japonica]
MSLSEATSAVRRKDHGRLRKLTPFAYPTAKANAVSDSRNARRARPRRLPCSAKPKHKRYTAYPAEELYQNITTAIKTMEKKANVFYEFRKIAQYRPRGPSRPPPRDPLRRPGVFRLRPSR